MSRMIRDDGLGVAAWAESEEEGVADKPEDASRRLHEKGPDVQAPS